MRNKFLTKLLAIIMICLIGFPFVATKAEASSLATTYECPAGNSTIYMHDLADLLADAEEEALINTISGKCQDISYNILFLTTSDNKGKSTMVYSDDYMDTLFPMDEDNIAFVIDMDAREIYINTTGKAIKCLSDNMIEKALDRGYAKITNEDYDGCLEAMATYCVSYLSDNPSRTGTVNNNAFLTKMLSAIPFALIITAVVIVILIGRHNKANKVQSATKYISKNDYTVLDKKEIFVRSYETVQRNYYKPKSSSSSGSGGGSSHSSSSGRSHGGGGRSF